MSTPNQGERLTRIETLLETMVTTRKQEREDLAETIREMAQDIRTIKTDLAGDKAELAELKNKGIGVIIGAALAGGGIGAALVTGLEKLKDLFG